MNQMLYREILIQLSMLVIYKGNFWEKTTTKKKPQKTNNKTKPPNEYKLSAELQICTGKIQNFKVLCQGS